MGKVEKVIVLSVLFFVALILVVTVTVDDPLDTTKVVEAGTKKVPAVAQGPVNPAANPNPLLSTNVATQPPAGGAAPVVPSTSAGSATQVPAASAGTAIQVPASGSAPAPGVAADATRSGSPATSAQPVAAGGAVTLPPGALLRTTEGLRDSWFADLKLYAWKEGDTWRSLANMYYGDWKRLDVLKRSNEGRMDVAPGEDVFIPVFADERARLAANSEPTDSAVADAAAPKTATGTSGAKAAPTKGAATKSTGAKIHVVTNGESLWTIAKKELGDGNRWKEIYEANRDILKKPESIQKGMRLRIP